MADKPATQPDPWVGLHYHVFAYVCGKACIRDEPFDKPVIFDTIFQERPSECRFAITQMVPLSQAPGGAVAAGTERKGPVLVWDLYDEQLVRGQRTTESGLTTPPPPLWTGDAPDGLIMKAMMLFDHDSP